MTNDLPTGWTWTTLEKIASWGSGGTPKRSEHRYYDGNIPWAVIGDLNDGKITECGESITQEGLDNSSCKLVEPGTVLVAMYGSIGKLGIAGMQMATNQAIAFANPHVDRNYLFYYLLSQRHALATAGKGATQRNISQTVLKPWPIPVAPSAEQERIVAAIEEHFSRLNAAEGTLQQSLKRLATLRSSILASAFPSPDRLPPGWSLINVRELCAVEYGKGLRKKERVQSGSIGVYGSAGIVGYHDVALVDEPVVIVGRKGNAGAVWVSEEPSWPIDTTYFLRVYSGVSARFLGHQLQKADLHVQDSSTTIPSLRRPDLESVAVGVPPLDEQHQVIATLEERLSRLDAAEATLRTTLDRSAALRRTVLAQAFAGRLVPQDPDDEPASALLARIASSRPSEPTKWTTDV